MISMIFASSRNGAIGRDGKLPWRLSEDLRRFKRLTTGGCLVMGRKTWESLDGKPLGGRSHLILSRNPEIEGVAIHDRANVLTKRVDDVAEYAEQVLRPISDRFPIWIVGGTEVFRAFLPRVDRIHWTRIDADVDGDTIFDFRPDQDNGWKMVASEDVPADADNEYKSTYMIFDRK